MHIVITGGAGFLGARLARNGRGARARGRQGRHRPARPHARPGDPGIVKTWPGHVEARRARGLGLLPDAGFEQVIRDYVRENPDAVKLPTNA